MRTVGLVWVLIGTGCSGSEEPKPGAQVEQVSQPAEGAAASTEAFDRTQALAAADLSDGVEDKVATQCAGCAFMMDGDPAHTIEVDGYSLHMCAGECKAHYESDLDNNLRELVQ